MAGQKPMADKLLVAVKGRNAFVKVIGRGSFKVSTPLREFGIAAIGMGCGRIIFEMSRCVGMDSTFMGTIAGLSLRMREGDSKGEVILFNLSEKTLGLIRTLGLNKIVSAYMQGDEPDAIKSYLAGTEGFETLIRRDESDQDTTQAMLDAHESLVDVEPENINKFRDVIDFLREDLNNSTSN